MNIDMLLIINIIIYFYFGYSVVGKVFSYIQSKKIKNKIKVTTINIDGEKKSCHFKRGDSPEVDKLIDAVIKSKNQKH